MHLGKVRKGMILPCPFACKTAMPVALQTVPLLCCSNLFMSFAWYAHLRELRGKPLWLAIFVSWGIALNEYAFQVPANRIGFTIFSLAQLKVIQETVTPTVFVPFALYSMHQPLK
jgi:uncharacterized protein